MGILMPISIFWLNHGSRFYYFMKQGYPEKTRSLMTYTGIKNTLTQARIKLRTLVVIGADCLDRC